MDYKFTYIDVGCNGRISDGGVFRSSSLSKALEENSLNVPKPATLDDEKTTVPYVIVADDAFPLKSYIMKPFGSRNLSSEQRIFNYRLSRARRIVENAFGILASRFRVFLSTISLNPVASCALHNYLRTKAALAYTPTGSVDSESVGGTTHTGEWRKETSLVSVGRQGTNTYSKDAKEVRDKLCEYFNNDDKCHGKTIIYKIAI